MEEAIAFIVREPAKPAVEVRVNFGVFAGRNATQAEIDDLARALNDEVESFAVLAVERHEFSGDSETSLRQVVIEVTEAYAGPEPEQLAERIVQRAERWAAACIHDRADLGELEPEL
ncbi:MAG TPA: hypothetical protein VFA30_04820 [Gaiellaceae bacterium]|nr:hypothetical protein [Gaiellaceae bacterium]